MATVDLGTFLAFIAVPTLTLIFMGKIRSWGFTGYALFLAMGGLSFIMLGGMALMMFFDYDVVIMENIQTADAFGNVTGSSIKTTPIIASFQDIWGLIISAFAVVFGVLYFYVMLNGGP